MFIKNYLVQRDLSIRETIAKKQNLFLTIYSHVMNQKLDKIVYQHFPSGCILHASMFPLIINNTLRDNPNNIGNVIKSIPYENDAIVVFPRCNDMSRYIGLLIRSDSLKLEVIFVENDGREKLVVGTRHYDQQVSFDHIMKSVRNECDRLWPTFDSLCDQYLPQVTC